MARLSIRNIPLLIVSGFSNPKISHFRMADILFLILNYL